VFALGFVSVFDQVLEGLPDNDRESLFNAYISSLDEDGSKYRQVITQQHNTTDYVYHSVEVQIAIGLSAKQLALMVHNVLFHSAAPRSGLPQDLVLICFCNMWPGKGPDW